MIDSAVLKIADLLRESKFCFYTSLVTESLVDKQSQFKPNSPTISYPTLGLSIVVLSKFDI
ncbi:hypothetical protein BpHYR1_041969 [Brachionus plicatilis]|uniref:Uncharacterized protein n=1 Tax=Brachionus plicatilis TaxID=10195 RepID=A0A3M7QDH9_BRAPC|nr:hypothetical protein BpHYR1_041969 [Brachionus plicatilis]